MNNLFHCAIFSFVAHEWGLSGCGVCLLFPVNEVLLWCLPTVTDGLNVSWYMRCLSVVTDDRFLFAVSPLRGVPRP